MIENKIFDINREQLSLIVSPLIQWYKSHRRDLPWRHNPTPYRVWISEIMLQQTRVDPVIPYYMRFMEHLPDVYSLATCPEDELMKLWEGLGYYSRARNLQKAAQLIVSNGGFPTDFEGWRALPGVGDYTAGAICSIALGLPTPAVDGNVLRVLSRILGSTADIAAIPTKKCFTDLLRSVYPAFETSELTQGLMELGATVCIPNGEPLCARCPLQKNCIAYKNQLTDRIPVKSAKKKRRTEQHTVLIVRCGHQIALIRRPEKGLLANLWQYPTLSGHATEEAVLQHLKKLAPMKILLLSDSTHIFTHIEWQMKGYEVVVSKCDEPYTWFSIEELLQSKAIPSAYRSYTQYLKDLRYEVLEHEEESENGI